MPGAAILRGNWVQDSDSTRFVLLGLWSFSLLITAGLNITALWLAALGALFLLSTLESKFRDKSGEPSNQKPGWSELGIIGVWGVGPMLVYLSNHPEKLTVSVIMLVCAFLIVLGRYRSSARPAFIIAAPYFLLSFWLLYKAFGTSQFTYMATMVTLIFGTFVTMTVFSVRTHRENQTVLAEKETLIRELKIARRRAERSARFKSEFLASMSHEIRTPLNGVIGMADLIEGESRETVTKWRAKTIMSCGKSLLNLINDVLDLAKIEAEGLTLHSDPYDVLSELKSLADLWQIPAEQKGLSFSLGIDPKTPRQHVGDIHRIKQCLNNLIGNAIKFTEAGGVRISVSFKTQGSKQYLIFSVTDTGPGIDAAFQEKMFTPFKQSDLIDKNKTSGTGLGLSIVKTLTERMGGGIKLISKPGQGSRFVMWTQTISEARSDGQSDQTVGDFEIIPSLEGQTFLLVDDIYHNLHVLDQMIRSLGGKVYQARNGQEALDKLKLVNVDMIFMDIRMPVMDGVAATLEIRKLGASNGRVPIIAYSSNALPEDKTYYKEIGMNAHLAKPVTRRDLIQIVKRFSKASEVSEKMRLTG